jgi:hypothetical protein
MNVRIEWYLVGHITVILGNISVTAQKNEVSIEIKQVMKDIFEEKPTHAIFDTFLTLHLAAINT